jgi:hypothetical protein
MESIAGMSHITLTLEEEPFQFLRRPNLEDERTFQLYCLRLEDVYKNNDSYTSSKNAFLELDASGIEYVPQRYLNKLAEYTFRYDHKDEIERKKVADLKLLNDQIQKAKVRFEYKVIVLISKRDELYKTIDKHFNCYGCDRSISECYSSSLKECNYATYELLEEEQAMIECITDPMRKKKMY